MALLNALYWVIGLVVFAWWALAYFEPLPQWLSMFSGVPPVPSGLISELAAVDAALVAIKFSKNRRADRSTRLRGQCAGGTGQPSRKCGSSKKRSGRVIAAFLLVAGRLIPNARRNAISRKLPERPGERRPNHHCLKIEVIRMGKEDQIPRRRPPG